MHNDHQTFSLTRTKQDSELTEKDYKKAVSEALDYAVVGFIIPLVAILAIWMLPRKVATSRKSQDPKILKKATVAENIGIALFYHYFVWSFIWILPPATKNLYVGIIIAIISLVGTYYYGKSHLWSKKKIISFNIITLLVLAFGIYLYIYNV